MIDREKSIKNLLGEVNHLKMENISTGMGMILSAHQKGKSITHKLEYKTIIPKALDFLERAEAYLEEMHHPIVTELNLLNEAETAFVDEYFLLGDKEKLPRLRTLLNCFNRGVLNDSTEVEELLKFYDNQTSYVNREHQEIFPTF